MRVLLLGATGNLGSRLVPALLAHEHKVTVLIRSVSKLEKLISPALIAQINVVVGDATILADVKKVILDHNVDTVVNSAGNQVGRGKEHVLSKIARAVSDAAIAVGEQRGGPPLRAWMLAGIGLCRYPGTEYLIQDYMPKFGTIQHQETRDVLLAIPLSKLDWSLLCVAMMEPVSAAIEPLAAPRPHNILAKDGAPPAWVDSWVRKVPVIGIYLNILPGVFNHTTDLEDVADFLAEDLQSGSTEWVGKVVGIKQKNRPPMRSLAGSVVKTYHAYRESVK